MPYKIVKRGNKAEVVNSKTGKGHGVTTMAKAKRQKRLLEGVEHGWKPSYKKKMG